MVNDNLLVQLSLQFFFCLFLIILKFHYRSRNSVNRSVPTIHEQPLQPPQFVQVEVSDADNQQFIVYADQTLPPPCLYIG